MLIPLLVGLAVALAVGACGGLYHLGFSRGLDAAKVIYEASFDELARRIALPGSRKPSPASEIVDTPSVATAIRSAIST